MADEIFFFPPFHPSCRCALVAIKDIKAYAMEQSSPNNTDQHIDADAFNDVNYQYLNMETGKIAYKPMPPHHGFKSVDEIQRFYRKNMPNLDLSGFINGDVSDATIISAMDSFEKLRRKFAASSYDLKGITLTEGNEEQGTANSIAWYDHFAKTLHLNKSFWSKNNIGKLEDAIYGNMEQGFQVKSSATAINYTIYHEFGHMLYYSLSENNKKELSKIFNEFDKKQLSQDISEYSTKNKYEFFAEIFTGIAGRGQMSVDIGLYQKFRNMINGQVNRDAN